MPFTYRGREFDYFDHEYNATATNERSFEVPIARDFIARQQAHDWLAPRGGIEIGNVLSHYGPTSHRVVDRYEVADGVDNIDVFDVCEEYDWLVAISTFEHVRTQERRWNTFGGFAALVYSMGLVRRTGSMLVTIPIHQNDVLDDVVFGEDLPFAKHWSQTVYVHDHNGWHHHDEVDDWGTAVWIGEWNGEH